MSETENAQKLGSCKPLLNNHKTEDQTNNSNAIRGSCYSSCNEGGNTEEEPKVNEDVHGCIQDTKFSCNKRNIDATECQNIGSEYHVDEKLELVILDNNGKIKKTSILNEQDELTDDDSADTRDSSLIHTENNISMQIEIQLDRAVGQHEIRKDSTENEENKYYSLDKIGRALEDREHIYNKTKDDLKPETKVEQDLDRTNLDEYYGMRNSFDDIEDERRQRENNDDSYHLTELKSIANHASIENNEVECEISDVSIINSFDEVNEENSDGQVNLIEDNEAIYESIRDEDKLRDFRFQDFDENERFY
ncbi:unnamed protein product [Mytilus edulis]|uniref:Uncharacterized protein n=1 Tax=Mytilus edulis TaxID=6550 RepID=A0A8S3S5Y3_MYTED|nr:unnamed protein product [Mytilus edulis]